MKTTKTADELTALQDRLGEMTDEIRRLLVVADTQDDRELLGHLSAARTELDGALLRTGRMVRACLR